MDWPQYKKRTEYIMVEHKLVPVFMDGKPGFGICILTCSHAEQSGNLRLYCQNDSVFEEYSFPYQKWQARKAVHLTDLEKVILKFAKQGLTNRAIADKLCISDTHLTHTLTDLYEKLGVNSMRKAIICVTNSLLLFKPDRREVDEVAEISDSVEKKDTKPSKFSKKLTDEVLQLIKNKVNAGQTHRHIARELGIDEKTVRNAIKSGFFPPKT